MYKFSMKAKKSPYFLECEAHVLALINFNLMIFNEIDIDREFFELTRILIAIYLDPKITNTKFGKHLILISSDNLC